MLHRLACNTALASDGLLLLMPLYVDARFPEEVAQLPAPVSRMCCCDDSMLLLLLLPRALTYPVLPLLATTGSMMEVTWKPLSSREASPGTPLHRAASIMQEAGSEGHWLTRSTWQGIALCRAGDVRCWPDVPLVQVLEDSRLDSKGLLQLPQVLPQLLQRAQLLHSPKPLEGCPPAGQGIQDERVSPQSHLRCMLLNAASPSAGSCWLIRSRPAMRCSSFHECTRLCSGVCRA